MVLAEGRWAWWNPYGALPLASCVRRAQAASGVIVKWGYPQVRTAFAQADLPWATERYVYPNQPEVEARRLASDVSRGAAFAVINAEVEWERLGPEPMRRLIAEFRRHQPTTELYASVDTRADRMALPYQRVLAEHAAGWMPMIYPKAFRSRQPAGYVAQAFQDCLDGKDFGDRPVLPTLQTYDGIGAEAVRAQLAEVDRRGLPGCQAYTIAHASDEEWQAFVSAELDEGPRENDVEAIEELRRDWQRFVWDHGIGHAIAALYLRAAAHALRSEPLPEELKDSLRRIIR